MTITESNTLIDSVFIFTPRGICRLVPKYEVKGLRTHARCGYSMVVYLSYDLAWIETSEGKFIYILFTLEYKFICLGP